MFCMNSPLGNFHCLMLSAEPEANMNCVGCRAKDRTDFLWWVRTESDFPAAKSQRRTVQSWEAVII